MECILYVLRSRLDVGSPGLLGGPTWAPLAVSHNTHPHKSLWATAESKLYFGFMFCLVGFDSNECTAIKSYMIHIWRLIKAAKTTSYNYLITHPHKSRWASAKCATCNLVGNHNFNALESNGDPKTIQNAHFERSNKGKGCYDMTFILR